ncbi:hypothetical protein [Providencia rettgeri]|uniref:hypothetical protein n=1 Tax=Providencia rettgeri TaxID=587 RepID=UPI00155E5F8A|nr:hypothetical protein [Providencia rettgeri]QKG45199.1 hypothetical protein HRD55_11635 [Providencia rettgeri]QNN31435.1 hypothetical protein H9X60_11635 [Providencia rettgeri]
MNEFIDVDEIKKKVKVDFDKLMDILEKVDVKAVISIFFYESVYGKGLPIIYEKIISLIPKLTSIDGKSPDFNDIKIIKENLSSIDTIERLFNDDKPNIGGGIEKIYSMNKNFIRGEYYGLHATDYFKSLFEIFEESLISGLGCSYKDAELLFLIINRIYLSETHVKAGKFKLKKQELIELYKKDKREFYKIIGGKIGNKKSAYKHIDFYVNIEFVKEINDIFFLGKDEILNCSGERKVSLNKLINHLSLQDLSILEEEKTYNIFSKKPLLFLDGTYFCVHLDMIYKSFYQLADEFLRNNKELSKKYNKHRAANLEEKAINLLKSVMVDSEVYQEIYYDSIDTGLQCEVDGLLKYKDTLFIIEAKAHKISEQAVDGSTQRVKKHVEQIIKEAYEQCIRTKRSLFSEGHDPKLRYKNKKRINLDLSDVRNIVLMPISQERFDEFTSNPHFVSETNLFNNDELPWAINIFDLYVIVDILDKPHDLIDYVYRRVNYSGRNSTYIHDELDWLGYYTCDRLRGVRENIDSHEFNMVMFEPNSTKFDDYYIKGLQKPHFYSNIFIDKLINKQLEYEMGYYAIKGFCFFDKKGLGELAEMLILKEKDYKENNKSGTAIFLNKEQNILNLFCFYHYLRVADNSDEFFQKRVESALRKVASEDLSGFSVYLTKIPVNTDFNITGVDFICKL